MVLLLKRSKEFGVTERIISLREGRQGRGRDGMRMNEYEPIIELPEIDLYLDGMMEYMVIFGLCSFHTHTKNVI